MKKIYILLILLIITSFLGCKKTSETPKTETVADLSLFKPLWSQSSSVKANDSSMIFFKYGPIESIDGSIKTNSVFEIKSVGLEISKIYGNVNVESMISLTEVPVSNQTEFSNLVEEYVDGNKYLSFFVKVPTKTGIYKIQINPKGQKNNGWIYLSVTPNDVHSLGQIRSEFFEDLSPYNGQKDGSESFAIIRKIPTKISVGPVVDKYDNLITNQKIKLITTQEGVFEQNKLSQIDISSDNGNGSANIFIDSQLAGIKIGAFVDNENKVDSTYLSLDDSDPLLAGKIFSRAEFPVLKSVLNVIGSFDFGSIFVSKSKEKIITLQNLGNTVINNLQILIEAPFVKMSSPNTCFGKMKLNPLEICDLKIKYTPMVRNIITSNSRFGGTYIGQDLEDQNYLLTAKGVFPPQLNLFLENNLMMFDSQPVGQLISKSFSVYNSGDVPAQRLKFINPPPNLGQVEPYFAFRSPPSSVLNEEPSLGDHCGETIAPQQKCRLYIDFLPKEKVISEMLSGSIIYEVDGYTDTISPLQVYVSGSSFVNNFDKIIPVNSIKKTIYKDQQDFTEVVVGPIRNTLGAVEKDIFVNVEIYTEDGGVNKTVGDVFGSNEQIIGTNKDLLTFKTKDNGTFSFKIKSRVQDLVGKFKIRAKIMDMGIELASGENEFEYVGAKLKFNENIFNFLNVIINDVVEKDIVISNEGSMIAQNIKVFFENQMTEYSVSSEGTCVGLLAGSLKLQINESCSFKISFSPKNKLSYFNYLKSSMNSIGNNLYSSVYGIGINPAVLDGGGVKINGTYIINSDKFVSNVIFSNVGDEAAKNFNVFSESENQSFSFSLDCLSNLPAGRNCRLTVSYKPNIIPDSALSTNIIVKAFGETAGGETTLKIPVKINHSSLQFNPENKSAINVGKCLKLNLNAFDGDGNPLIFNEDLTVPVSIVEGIGQFYSNSSCTMSLNSTKITAGNSSSNDFYFMSLLADQYVKISAGSSFLSTALNAIYVYENPTTLSISSGNSQNGFVEKILPKAIAVKAKDLMGRGIPNIPIYVDVISDISKENQYILNSEFAVNINGWTVNSGAATWSKIGGGSIALNSSDSVVSVRSQIVSSEQNKKFILVIKVSEIIGSLEAGSISANIIEENGNPISSFDINGKYTDSFVLNIPSNVSSFYVEIKTKGKSNGTTTYVGSINLIKDLSVSTNAINGEIITQQPIYTNDEGVAEIKYLMSRLPSINLLKIYSTYPSLSDFFTIGTFVADYPTNIKGDLGDLVISQAGYTLMKNGVDNSSSIKTLSGFLWDSNNKTLYLPANKTYDFNSIRIDVGTSLKFLANERKESGWTQLYGKDGCFINGRIESKGFWNNGSKTLDMMDLDGSSYSAVLPDYLPNPIAGTGGAGGYIKVTQTRDVTTSGSTVIVPLWNTIPMIESSFISVFTSESPLNGTFVMSPDGSNGRQGIAGDQDFNNSANYNPIQTKGGIGGNRGLDGGNLYINCYALVSGSGTIDVSGGNGLNGMIGSSGTFADTVFKTEASKTVGTSTYPIVQSLYKRINGGAGGGAGGNGGFSGNLILKSRNLQSNSVEIKAIGGAGGSGGTGGLSYKNVSNGTSGQSGVSGVNLECAIVDMIQDIITKCN